MILSDFSLSSAKLGWTFLFFETINIVNTGLILILILIYFYIKKYISYVDIIKNQSVYLHECLKEQELKFDLSYRSQAKIERLDAARQERERIYQDIHDGIGSRLVAAVFNIRRGNIMPRDVEKQLLDCLIDLRSVMNSENEQNNDIQSTIFECCNNFEHLIASDILSLNCYISDGPAIHLKLQTHLNIIRILQEALTNIIKHANACEIRVEFSVIDSEIILCISDNGEGINVSSDKHKVFDYGMSGKNGVLGMTARALTIGGNFSLDRVGLWTVARLRVPYISQLLIDDLK